MVFSKDEFSTRPISDNRLQGTLELLAKRASIPVTPDQLLAATVCFGDSELLTLLETGLRQGSTKDDLRKHTESILIERRSPEAVELQRSDFAESSLTLLDEFSQSVESSDGALDALGLELLCSLLVSKADDEMRLSWEMLDFDRATEKLQEKIAMGVLGSTIREGIGTLFQNLLSGVFTGDDSKVERKAEPKDGPFELPKGLPPCIDLTFRVKRAGQGGVSPFAGDRNYELLFDKIARALHRRSARHVLLVGPRGVGKSTAVVELARIAADGVFPLLLNKRVVSVRCQHTTRDISREILAGILSQTADCGDLIVCLDGFASLIRSDRAESNKSVLLSALETAKCSFIGLITPHEFAELFVGDVEILENFAPIEIEEPDIPTALGLMMHFAAGMSHEYKVEIADEAIESAVVLSSNYILNEQLPSKAVKVLSHICEDIVFETRQLGRKPRVVTSEDVVRVVSEISGVPEETLQGIAERSDFERSLSEEIVGQDHAVKEMATELSLIKAGLVDPGKPASVLLFLGQTGTGKTEMAKAVARFYSSSKRLRTYTLGNFVEPHSVAGIIGVPPGYVGHDQGGRIVNDLNSDPYCVFLLDEADKAHPDVLQPFLNLFDEGWVRDQRGTQGFADKAIFILTTNVGQKMIADMNKQGKSIDEITTRMKETLAQIKHGKANRPVFAPEFLARIKRIIVFGSLDENAMIGIGRKLFRDMKSVWENKRRKKLVIPDDLIEHLGKEAHRLNEKSQGKEGGRIVRKLIADQVETVIQRTIADNPDKYRSASKITILFSGSSSTSDGNGREGDEIQVAFE